MEIEKSCFLLTLFSDTTLYVIHFTGDVFFLGFHVIWGSVLKHLLENWKLHQLKILRPGGDLLTT